jgi:2,4'-dihydroxyacetophenone dioxygenase
MVKYLRIDVSSAETVSLLRMPAHMHLPRHRHIGPVTVYTLEGSWRYLEHDWIAQPGSLIWEPAGSCHSPLTLDSESGTVTTLNMVQGDLEILNRHGKVVAIENCDTAMARQDRAKSTQGVSA